MLGYSFIFGDADSADIGLRVEGIPDLGTAQRDGELIKIPGKDGDDYVDQGRYNNVQFALNVAVIQKGSKTVRELIDDVINEYAYLHGYHWFEDSEHFNLATEAVLVEFGDFRRELRKMGKATMKFSRKPFWFDVSGLQYTDVSLVPEIPTKSFTNPFKLTSKPIIKFEITAGSPGNFQYSITDPAAVGTTYSGYLSSTASTLIIDFEKESATINGSPIDLTIPKGFETGVNTFKLLSNKDRMTSVQIMPRWRRL